MAPCQETVLFDLPYDPTWYCALDPQETFMFVEPKLDEVVNGKRGMLNGIQVCLESECLVSAVSLMFSSVDALAALTRPIGQQSTNGAVFKAWVDRYIQSDKILGCTSDDLWGARCGVLHLYSPDSDLSAKNKARRIYYQWSAEPAVEAARTIPAGSLVIYVEALHKAVVQAAHDFIADSEMDSQVKQLVQSHLPSMLCYEPYPALAVTLDA